MADDGSSPFKIPPDHFEHHPTQHALLKDGEIAERQVKLLTGPEAQARILEILESMRHAQDVSTRPDAVPFDIWKPGSVDASFILCGRGKLVVERRSADGELTTDDLPIDGYVLDDPDDGDTSLVPPGALRVSVYRAVEDKLPGELASDVRRLKELGVTAACDYVVPLGHIVKGDDFPEVATQPLTYPPKPFSVRPRTSAQRRIVRVALMDTGITGVPRRDGWLRRIGHGPAAIDQLNIMPPMDRLDWFAGHGTFVAGVVEQIAPDVEIVAYRFTGPDGIGTERDLAAAILRAAKEAAEPEDKIERDLIINLSVGTPAIDDVPPIALRQAVAYVAEQYPRFLMVASAGNNGNGDPMYPAAFDEVLAVGALNADLSPAAFSTFGDWVACSCVGTGVVSTFVEGKLPPVKLKDREDAEFLRDGKAVAVWSGTSFTAPQISAAIALICHMDGIAPKEARDRLLADRLEIAKFGAVIGELLTGTPLPPQAPATSA